MLCYAHYSLHKHEVRNRGIEEDEEVRGGVQTAEAGAGNLQPAGARNAPLAHCTKSLVS